MEELADLYSTPSIHFGVKVIAMEAAGDLVFKASVPANLVEAKPMVFSTDGVHPHVETGHRVYSETIARDWPAIRDASGSPRAHALPTALRSDNWELARQVPITREMLRGEWQQLPKDHKLAKQFQLNMPVIFQAQKPGEVTQ